MAQAATILRTSLKDGNKLTMELKTNCTENNQDGADKITCMINFKMTVRADWVIAAWSPSPPIKPLTH